MNLNLILKIVEIFITLITKKKNGNRKYRNIKLFSGFNPER